MRLADQRHGAAAPPGACKSGATQHKGRTGARKMRPRTLPRALQGRRRLAQPSQTR